MLAPVKAPPSLERLVEKSGDCKKRKGLTNLTQLIPALAALWKQGRFPIDQLITRYSYRDIHQAMDDMRHGKCVKPVLIW